MRGFACGAGTRDFSKSTHLSPLVEMHFARAIFLNGEVGVVSSTHKAAISDIGRATLCEGSLVDLDPVVTPTYEFLYEVGVCGKADLCELGT